MNMNSQFMKQQPTILEIFPKQIPYCTDTAMVYEGTRVEFKRSRSLIKLAKAFCGSQTFELSRKQIRDVLGVRNYDDLSPRMKDSVNLRVLKQISRLRKALEKEFSGDYFCVAFIRETDSWKLFIEKCPL